MVHHRCVEAVLLLLTVAVCVRADSNPSPPTGFLKEVRVSAPTRIDWRFVLRCIPNPDKSCSNPDADKNYDSRQQRYQLYVPQNYTPTKAWPLVVFINSLEAANTWPYWQKPCEKLGMLYCEAQGAGNGCSDVRRTRIVLDMLDDVRRHYRIDPLQTYLAGQSGGGRMACNVGLPLPEYFGGVIPVCGTEPLPWSMPCLRHRIHDRQSVAFITGVSDFNREENESYMAPLFKDLGIRSKLWVVKGMGHSNAKPEILTEALQWLTADLPRRQADAKSRPGLSVAPDEAPTGEQQAAGQLEAARAEAKRSERLWQGAALAQGILDRWGQSSSAGPARKFLEDLQSDPQRTMLLTQQRRADEWIAQSARARAREQYSYTTNKLNGMPFGGKSEALKDWQQLARKYTQTPEGKKAEAEAKRLEGVLAATPKLPYEGIRYAPLSWKVASVEKDGPADKAGVQPGDVVIKFEGNTLKQDIRSVDGNQLNKLVDNLSVFQRQRKEVSKSVQKHKPGDQVHMEILRNGKPLALTIPLGGRPEGPWQNLLPKGW